MNISKPAASRKKNPRDYQEVPTSDILEKESGWVGTKNGMEGFLKKTTEELEKGFKYCPDIFPKRDKPHGWITLCHFKLIYNWKTHGLPPCESFMNELRSRHLDHLLLRDLNLPNSK